MVNSPLPTMTEGHQRNILKTPPRRPLVPATLTTTRGRHLLLTIRPGVSTFEDSCRANLREKCHKRKIQRVSAAIPEQTFNCSRCGWTCIQYLCVTVCVCVCVYIYIYIYTYKCMCVYIYICICIRGAFNKFPDFFGQLSKIFVDS